MTRTGASADTGAPAMLDWQRDGARLHAGAALGEIAAFETMLADVDAARAGSRLHDRPKLETLLTDGAIWRIAADALGDQARPVRALLFDKQPGGNWALGWHQDRTIVVAERHEVAGFGPWTVKQGLTHVAPPPEVTAHMVTLRLHLDDVPADNAPLLIAPGTHRLGRIAEPGIAALVEQAGVFACLARRGDVWAYATAILHASAASAPHHRHRRVLQVDYAAHDLPGGLRWRGL